MYICLDVYMFICIRRYICLCYVVEADLTTGLTISYHISVGHAMLQRKVYSLDL